MSYQEKKVEMDAIAPASVLTIELMLNEKGRDDLVNKIREKDCDVFSFTDAWSNLFG